MARARPVAARTAILLSVAAALIVAAAPASAQPAPGPGRPFPYEVGRRDMLLLPAAAGVSLLGDLVAPVPDPLGRTELEGLSPDDVNAFDRVAARSWSESWGTASDRGCDALLGAAVLVSFAPQVVDGRWRDAVTLGVMFTEAALLVEGATYLAKDLAGRRRPWTHNTSLSVEERLRLSAADPLDARRSFFSGHAAVAFTLATIMSTVFADVHGRSRASDALWAASLSAAALTGLARVKSGMHYPSDVLVGAAVGAAIGRVVPALHRIDRASPVQVHAGPGGISVTIPLGGAR
ncbi:MAG TPA: phosphatase PAP2 family protein [Longimicrobiales bacterium]|nr:phosphatase PAP2 family protein [Longimicrobiales bacterium]